MVKNLKYLLLRSTIFGLEIFFHENIIKTKTMIWKWKKACKFYNLELEKGRSWEHTIWTNRWRINGLRSMKKSIEISNTFLLLFLSLSCFVILKPVKDILSFDVTIHSKPSSDFLYFFSTWCLYSLLIQILQHTYLFFCWVPSWTWWNTIIPIRPLFIHLIIILTLHSSSSSSLYFQCFHNS